MVDMSVKIGAVTLKNPVMPASGCFSTDLAQVMDLNRLGALVAKTVSREFRAGNPPPRAAEVEGGMINSIGLPTKGIDYFLEHQVPDYKRFTPPLVGSISATTIEDFEAMARDVAKSAIDVLEVNISCPTRDPKGGNFDLFLINRDGTGLQQITFDQNFDGFPMFSPDGKKYFVANGLTNDITVIDVDSLKAEKSVPVGRLPWGVAVMP